MTTVNRSEDSKSKPRPSNSGRTSIANRDRPLFTSRRRPQHQPEFTTESLNTTWIPSPSPAKAENRGPTIAKPRHARRDTKGFGAALKAIENRKESSYQGARTGTVNGVRKDSSNNGSHEVLEASPSPSPKIQHGRSRTQTPSPPRVREYDALISPTSDASSPPKGLAETYQQIFDEEDIAAQSRSGESASDGQESDVARNIDYEHHQRLQASPSPSNRRTSQTQSPVPTSQEAQNEPAAEADDRTESSNFSTQSQDSTPAGRFRGSLPSRREQDQQRVDAALGTGVQPFRKTKRSGLTVEDLRRDETSSQSGSSSQGSNVNGSVFSEPSLNVPQAWGRKGRHGRTWLNRMSGPRSDTDAKGDSLEGKSLEAKDKFQSIQDWQATAASTPLPPVTQSDSLQPSSEAHDPLTTIKAEPQVRSMASREQVRRWEHGEPSFARPYPAENALVRPRNSAIDLIREREIQNLNRSAVTTNRLGELKERQSLERIGRRSASTSTESIQSPEVETGSGSIDGKDAAEKSSLQKLESTETQSKGGALDQKDEQSAPLDLSTAAYGSRSATPTLSDSNGEAKLRLALSEAKGNETRDLLRRLARVASPDSIKQSESIGSAAQRSSRPGLEESASRSDNSNVSKPARDAFSHAERSQKGQSRVENTPQQTKNETYLKTPLVTGAWIDTPLPATFQRQLPEVSQASAKTNLDLKSIFDVAGLTADQAPRNSTNPENPLGKLEETVPKLPKSALTAIIERAKEKRKAGIEDGNDDTLQLDDSTIESLEELLASSEGDLASSSPPSPPEQPVPTSMQSLRKTPSVPKSKKLQRKRGSDADSDDFTSRLSVLQSSLIEAKQGIGSIQKRLRRTSLRGANRGSSRSASQSGFESECDEAGEFHDFIWPCEKCGRSQELGVYDNLNGSLFEWQWRPIQVLIPRLWYWPSRAKMPRLTQLGWWATLALALVVAELILR